MKLLIGLALLVFAFSSCHQAPAHQSKSIWKPYSKQAIKDSVAQHKPIVIDFFADWCPNCHDLDEQVFSLPEIQAKLSRVTT
jgi:thiol:disulfide interchange protein